MSEATHGLMVCPAGMKRAVVPSTGEEDWCGPDVALDEAVAYLPHSCDEWVVGCGSTAEVIDSLLQLRTEVDAAISYLSKGSGK